MMDIRTLLTETKSFAPKRKADSFPQDFLSRGARTFSHLAEDEPPSSPMNRLKTVKFTLDQSSRSLSLTISPHDPPSAITSTVKDFFALHNCGVSFTDAKGSILIVTPDNLTDEMEVIVNQTGLVGLKDDNKNNVNKKRRKSTLSSRKRSKKVLAEKQIVEEEREEDDYIFRKESHERKRDNVNEASRDKENEKRERTFSPEILLTGTPLSKANKLMNF